MKILITGGSGFVGRNLSEYFSNKKTYQVISPTSKQLNLLDSARVEKYIKKHRPHTIIHCASAVPTRDWSGDWSSILQNNLLMFFNLARVSKLYKRMFYFGSGAEYDVRHYQPKMNEDYFDSHVPADGYGFSKYICSQFAGQSNNIYDLRLFGCFGSYERWQVRFISQSICKAIYGMDIKIGQNVKFDYLYVKDLGEIVEKLMMKQKLNHHHYNICTGQSISLLTIAKEIKKISGKGIKIEILKPGMKKEYSGDNSRLKAELQNIFFTPLPMAIEELYSWYQLNKKEINKKELLTAL